MGEIGVPGENHQSAASQTNYITIDEGKTINLKKSTGNYQNEIQFDINLTFTSTTRYK